MVCLKWKWSPCALAGVICLAFATAAAADGTTQLSAPAGRSSEVAPYDGQVPQMLGYIDVDKLRLDTLTNYYDDLNNNSQHDAGEPFAAQSQGGWGNPRSAPDNSCWLASACNMLQQLGKVSDGRALYMDYSLNGVPSPGGTLTWDDGGLQQYVISNWMTQNPVLAVGMQMNVHTWSGNVKFNYGHYAWQDWDPRAGTDGYLDAGWEVGLGMWPLFGSGQHEGGHALTIQEVFGDNTFSCTDSDRDGDWTAAGDLNTYNDMTLGPTSYQGNVYYGWINDFYSGDFNYWPDGDVGYVVAIVPEPATLSLLVLGGLAILRRRSGQALRRRSGQALRRRSGQVLRRKKLSIVN